MLLGDDRRVARVDIASRTMLSTTTLPFTPGGIAAGGGDAWVTEDGGDGLVRLDGTTGAIARRFSVPARGDRSREPDRHRLRSGLRLGGPRARDGARRPPDRGGRSTASRPRCPRRPSSSPATTVWVAGAENGRIVEDRPGGEPHHGRHAAARHDHRPRGRQRNSVWVAIVPDDVVFRLSPDDGSVLATIPAGDGPSTLSAGDGLWIANARGREIVRVEHGGARERLPTTGTPWVTRYHDGLLWTSVAAPEPVAATAATGGTLRIPLVSDDIGTGRPRRQPRPGLPPARVRDLRVPPQLPRRRGGRRPGAPARGRGRDADVSPDGRTYTFRIRPGFRFSPPSGQAVTAETFRATIERALSPRLATGGHPNAVGSLLADVVGATAYAAGQRAAHPRHHGARRHAHDPADARRAGDLPARLAHVRSSAPCRSARRPCRAAASRRRSPWRGPYYVASAGGGQVVLERNPNYTGDRPRRIERIVYTRASRPPTRSRASSTGAPTTSAATPWLRPGRPARARRRARPALRPGEPRPAARAARATCRARRRGSTASRSTRSGRSFRDVRMRRAAAYALDRRALAAVFGEQPTDRLVPAGRRRVGGNIAYPRRTRPGRGAPAAPARARPQGDPLLLRRSRPAGASREIVRANLAEIGIDVRIDAVARVPDRPATRSDRGGRHAAHVARRRRRRSRRRSSSSRSATRYSRARATGATRACATSRQRPRRRAAPPGPPPTPRWRRRSCATPCPSRSTPAGSTRSSSRRASAASVSQGALNFVDLGALCLRG